MPEFQLTWSSLDVDISSFDLEIALQPFGIESPRPWQPLISATSATSLAYIAPRDDHTYRFRLRARDETGNVSEWKTLEDDYSRLPAAINEIAWMGTGTSAKLVADEWIELYNKTARTLSVSGWRVVEPETGFPAINARLTGEIPPRGYYLLERTADDVISDVAADATYTGALRNEGMALSLRDTEGREIDRTHDGALWPAGNNQTKATMERINPSISGRLRANWFTNNSRVTNGVNAEGEPIIGTPKARNSVWRIYHTVSQPELWALGVSWTKDESPYYIPGFPAHLTVTSTLAIEPGVVVKLAEGAFLNIEGTIRANGTAEETVVFTSFRDDDFAGDANQDATSTVPERGYYWQSIEIRPQSVGSEFHHTIFRYGGRPPNGAWTLLPSMVTVDETSATFEHATFEHAFWTTLRLYNSPSRIAESAFRNAHTGVEYGCDCNAVLAYGGSPVIEKSSFDTMLRGINLREGATPTIRDNAFANITETAILNDNALGLYSGNAMATSVGLGIVVRGTLPRAATFRKDTVPYIIQYLSTYADGVVTIEPGVIFKFDSGFSHDFSVLGALYAEGTAEEPIIFTSLYDDSVGGDTDRTGTSIMPVAGYWKGIMLHASSSAVFRHVALRYGGYWIPALSADHALSLEISDAAITDNKGDAVLIESTTTTIVRAAFERNERGITLVDSPLTLEDVLFRENSVGIQAFGDYSISASGVTFEDNTRDTLPDGIVP